MRTVKEILTDISNICLEHIMINSDAMNACHSLGYNGLKRWHRVKYKKFNDFLICLENKSIDYYDFKIKDLKSITKYEPTSIIVHISNYLEILKKDLDKISSLNKEFYEVTGFEAPKLCEIKKEFLKSIEKSKRIIKRYQEIGNHAIAIADLHQFDDRLHEKIKQYEESQRGN